MFAGDPAGTEGRGKGGGQVQALAGAYREFDALMNDYFSAVERVNDAWDKDIDDKRTIEDLAARQAGGEPLSKGAADALVDAQTSVIENQKASGSWLQRQMGVGYNTAAKWIERMEEDGFVGPANHVGRREIYRDRDGNPL